MDKRSVYIYIFNKIEHAASAESTQEVGKCLRLRFAFLSTLLSCSRHLLRALFLNGARLKLVYLFYNIELENFHNKTAFISRQVSYLTKMKK